MMNLKPTNTQDGFPNFEEWKKQHREELISLKKTLTPSQIYDLYWLEYDGYYFCLEH